MADYDVVVLGAGPGGYVAAIRAGQLGMRTAVVEKDNVGGICLNWGCIPSKALLRNAEILSLFQHAQDFGITCDGLQADFGKAIDRSRQVVRRLTNGVRYLLRKNKVELIEGEGVLRDAHVVEIKGSGQTLSARNLIIATGARTRQLANMPIDGQTVVTSREALEMKELPPRVVIVGAGPTGLEFAYLYNAYGAQVTLVELLPHLAPKEDEEISQELEKAFRRQGIRSLTGSQVLGIETGQDGARVTVAGPQGEEVLECERVLVAVGVQGNSDGIGLEAAGVQVEKSWVPINDMMQTNVPHIYAIGDVTGKLLQAHVASAQGVTAVEHMAGLSPMSLDYVQMPRAIYCRPQIASIGLTEAEARQQGYSVKVGKFPMSASGKALALAEAEGMVKLVVDTEIGELLGAHMIGPEVTELLGEVGLARLLEGTTKEVGWLVHPHPSISETLKEAALAAEGEAIHI